MRFHSSFGSAAAELGTITLLFTSLLHSTQGALTPIPPPKIDLSSLGRVALAGSFDSIAIYSYEGQSEGSSTNGSQSVLQPLPNGAFAETSAADANINAMCPFVMSDGTFAGIVVGGNFTSLGGVDAQGIALFDPSEQQITPLPGIYGTVDAVLCDQETNSVYVGGSFNAANSTNAIAWVGMTGWANLPFAGFNAPVTSITKAPNGHIVFGGSFSGLGNATTPTKRDEQVVNIQNAQISASASEASYDPQDIICPANGTSGRPWLLPDESPGYWQASMGFGYQPTKLRLYNSDEDGKGTKTFRFTAKPINGIMNFTYTDPVTGAEAACDARCPLAQNSSLPYQDFHFVNLVGMNEFQIDISDWYGSGGGLAGIELFRDDIFAYAVNDFNEPSCASSQYPSSSSKTGNWFPSPPGHSGSQYLVANSSGTTQPSITFEPNLKQSGNYSILVYTPGCIQDDACATRGIVNVTASLTTTGGRTLSTQVFQTNDFDKFDQIYLGPVDASTDSFRPQVTLTPMSDQGTVVASRVRFDLIASTGGLNGLFEFDPDVAVVNINFTDSAINNAGTSLDPGASITSLVTHDETIYAAGNFTDSVFQNVMAFSNDNATSLPGEGLNAAVSALFSLDDFLYLGGNFTNTSQGDVPGLSNVASFSYSKNQWIALGAGLNGAVERIVPIQINTTDNHPETCISFNGAFTQILASEDNLVTAAQHFAIWVPSRSDWLQNLDVPRMALSGQLTAHADVPNGSRLIAGTLKSTGMESTGAVGLQSSSDGVQLAQVPVKFEQTSSQGSLSKRALTGNQNVTGVVTGLFYDNGGRNVTVYGGHFAAASSTGTTLNNLVFVNGSNDDAVTGLPDGVDQNSTFLTMDLQNDFLFAGGSVSGNIATSPVNGLVVYDFVQADYVTAQPPALQGENVVVSSIKTRPDSSDVYVGGSFDTAGALGCEGLCIFQAISGQWSSPGSALGGTVSSLTWASRKKLVVAGNLTISGNSTTLATYEPESQEWTDLSISQIPGPITAFAPATMDVSKWWAAGKNSDGSVFLAQYDGETYHPVTDAFTSTTNIRGLQVIGLTEKHQASDVLDRDQSLLVTGQIGLRDSGNASAVLYNGTMFTPFILSSVADGGPGSLSQLFSSNVNDLKGSGTLDKIPKPFAFWLI
jgi:Cortical protein marker for cell polarity